MFNKHAELRKIALLYTACRGLLRVKLAASTYDQWDQQGMNVNDLRNMSQEQLEDLYTQDTSHLGAKAQNWLNNWAQQQQGGSTQPQPQQPQPQPQQPQPQQLQPQPQPQQPQPQQQRRPTSPLQQKQMTRQQYLQKNQQQIQQAGQQAQQNATKGFFGRAMNWLTGGGYGGWAAGRAQAKQQRQLNQRYDQQGAQLRANQQKARQRMQGAQIQKFLMSRQPHQPANPVQTPKAAGYSLLSLFPGYRQLFNYV